MQAYSYRSMHIDYSVADSGLSASLVQQADPRCERELAS